MTCLPFWTSSSHPAATTANKLAGLKLKIVKPRGIIIAGSTAQFAGDTDMRDYFRMLNEGLKNVEVIPYDDLSRRLRNTVISIEKLEAASKTSKTGAKAKVRKSG
jgi:hypothetical protein